MFSLRNKKNYILIILSTPSYLELCPIGGGHTVMCPKDPDGRVSSIDTDQTAPKEQSDQCLHCLPRSICPNTWNFYRSLHQNVTGYRFDISHTFTALRYKPAFIAMW